MLIAVPVCHPRSTTDHPTGTHTSRARRSLRTARGGRRCHQSLPFRGRSTEAQRAKWHGLAQKSDTCPLWNEDGESHRLHIQPSAPQVACSRCHTRGSGVSARPSRSPIWRRCGHVDLEARWQPAIVDVGPSWATGAQELQCPEKRGETEENMPRGWAQPRQLRKGRESPAGTAERPAQRPALDQRR